jgi:hypothetical protein
MANQLAQKVTVNREDSVPIIVLPEKASDRLKNKIKGKIAAHESKKPESSKGLQDRMMEL